MEKKKFEKKYGKYGKPDMEKIQAPVEEKSGIRKESAAFRKEAR